MTPRSLALCPLAAAMLLAGCEPGLETSNGLGAPARALPEAVVAVADPRR